MKIKNLTINGGNQQFADSITNNNFSIIENEAQIRKIIDKYASDRDKPELHKSLDVICKDDEKGKSKKKFKDYLHSFLNSAVTEFGKEIITQGFKFIT